MAEHSFDQPAREEDDAREVELNATFDLFRRSEREKTFRTDRSVGHKTIESSVSLKIAADGRKLSEIGEVGENGSNAVWKLRDGLGEFRRITA